MSRILLLSASAGAGHTRAAQAVEEAAKARFPDATIRHEDVLDHVGRAYRKAYAGSFLQMVNHAPALWGALYDASDKVADVVEERKVRDKLVRFFDKLEFAPFRKMVRNFAPDAVISTHFLPAQVFAPSRKKGKDAFRFGLVVTDFDVHAYWVQPSVDRVCVATEELKFVLAARGVPAERITVTGIPISAAFSAPHDRAALRASLGLTEDRPAVLVMGGGHGVGSLEETVRTVLSCGPADVLAIAGRNEELKAVLEKLAPPAGTRLHVFGFVTRIAELMAVADVAVTKSGGLTTSECLAMGLPMVVRDPIPGQEERNADFLLEAGAGLKANGAASLEFKLRSLLNDRERLSRMSAAARRVGRPQAAAAVLETVLTI